jgi:hypothetical protein
MLKECSTFLNMFGNVTRPSQLRAMMTFGRRAAKRPTTLLGGVHGYYQWWILGLARRIRLTE